MIIAKYTFNEECVILEEGDGIGMLTRFYKIVLEYDTGDYIISLDHRPESQFVEYVHIREENPGFVLVLTDAILNVSDLR